ncbi:hypothetical protein B0H10DRAFT_2231470 [Mycena sp. CBHHK59/15]|nr:hypothetical protein B0H10DRAFT_2231470 [Mycena sp. CBHHK59/15]
MDSRCCVPSTGEGGDKGAEGSDRGSKSIQSGIFTSVSAAPATGTVDAASQVLGPAPDARECRDAGVRRPSYACVLAPPPAVIAAPSGSAPARILADPSVFCALAAEAARISPLHYVTPGASPSGTPDPGPPLCVRHSPHPLLLPAPCLLLTPPQRASASAADTHVNVHARRSFLAPRCVSVPRSALTDHSVRAAYALKYGAVDRLLAPYLITPLLHRGHAHPPRRRLSPPLPAHSPRTCEPPTLDACASSNRSSLASTSLL